MTETERKVLEAVLERMQEINDDIVHYEAIDHRDPKHELAALSLMHLRGEKAFLWTISSQLQLGTKV